MKQLFSKSIVVAINILFIIACQKESFRTIQTNDSSPTQISGEPSGPNPRPTPWPNYTPTPTPSPSPFSAGGPSPTPIQGGGSGQNPGIKSGCLTKNVPAPVGDSTSQQIENEILVATNQYRQSKGLGSLQMNPIMSAIARGHAENMAKGIYGFGHDFFSERIQVISCHGVGGYGAAENAAMGGGGGHGVVQMWINSSGHERNLTGGYQLIGIGVFQGYSVQIFM